MIVIFLHVATMGGSYITEERKIDLCSVKKIDFEISNILDKTDKVAYYTFDGSKWVGIH